MAYRRTDEQRLLDLERDAAELRAKIAARRAAMESREYRKLKRLHSMLMTTPLKATLKATEAMTVMLDEIEAAMDEISNAPKTPALPFGEAKKDSEAA